MYLATLPEPALADPAADNDNDTAANPAPTVPRLTKRGGLIGGAGVFTQAFLALEARFHLDAARCASCASASRLEGRLRCLPCTIAQRPPKLSAAARGALRAKGREIARQRGGASGGKRAGGSFFWA